MEHSQALEMNAPDRYVLGQLSAAEADAFEEHYFDCADCAGEVRLGMFIMEGGRRLVRETSEPVAPPAPMAPVVPIDSRSRWSKWIPAAAAAALMAIPINFALLMRMQNVAPRVVQVAAAPNPADALGTGDFIEIAVRSSGEQPKIVTADNLYFNVLANEQYETYKVQILNAAGKVESEKEHSSQEVKAGPLSINLHALRDGKYQLVVFGNEPAGKTEIGGSVFIVKREKQRGQLQQRGPRRQRWNSHTTQARARQAA